MKIVKAEAFPVKIELKEPFTFALGTITHSSQVYVCLTDESGNYGWGETTTFHHVYGYDQLSIYRILKDYLLPAVIGLDPHNMNLLNRKMEEIIPHNLMAKTGVDLAAYDLAGKQLGLPVHSMLGGKKTDLMPVIGFISFMPIEKAVDRALSWIEKGVKTIKIKIGHNPHEDIALLRGVRKAVGDDIKIRVDVNMGYDRNTAIQTLTRLEEINLQWIEQPLQYWDLEGLSILSQILTTPIAVDESMYSVHDAKMCIEYGNVSICNIKIVKCGGFYRSYEIASFCGVHSVPCFIGGTGEMVLGTIAKAHLYAASENIPFAVEGTASAPYTDDVAETSLEMTDGAIKIPDNPGLGIDIDRDKIEKFRI